MNFIISTSVLLNNLLIAQKALSTKTPAPYLQGIKMEVYQKEVVLVTSNSDISIKLSIKDESLKVESTGEALVPGRFFVDIIRKVEGETAELSVIDNNILRIVAGESDVVLNLLNIEDYPELEFPLNDEPIKLDSKIMKAIIRQTTFATSTIENRPILTGVNIRVEGEKLIAIATDSFRLSQKVVDIPKNMDNMNVVIPGRSLDELAKILEIDLEEILIHLNHKSILFEYGNVLFQSRLLEGNFPETSRLIPMEFPIVIKFNRDKLYVAVERASLLSSKEGTSSIVKLNLRNDNIVEITSNSPELGKVMEKVYPIEKAVGMTIKIAFSSKYFMDALKTFNSEEIFVKFTGEIRPFVLEGDNDPGLIQLILPVRTE
ncbi:MAG TPA: DNA polymerase III subunit beta [Bacillota bacterium]|nr:DNA polymerase III subunit beta [Bacillota bacterium]HPF42099.1 DNA polymerase III subunit beta [Bacillota bacterium]HPJ85821.1 DNA polymerase III subunit beta [Bacillota bacterium]HPQ61546.1 DNA polymerase III subunit beta [Bacillota bacterium]HRX91358.1 DNA polymerase III subunit beta [Candidatus Izemoplasmatales bacterium]